MKKRFMKKALAVVLSAAMAVSMSSTAQMRTASAAAKTVSLHTAFKTLKVGQKYKLKLKDNSLDWKIKKVVTSDKGIATVYGKTASYVMLKGKGEGRATIRVSLSTAKRKTNNKKTLRCRVKVVEAAPVIDPTPQDPVQPQPQDPVQTSAVVSTQAQLDTALNNKAVTSVTVKTEEAATFQIPSGQYGNVDLTVNAPNAEVVNSAVFKSVTIQAIRGNTWTEKARGNHLRIEAAKARIVADAAANVADLSITHANADVTIVIDGIVGGITATAKAKITISGKTTVKVPVSVSAAAAGSELAVSVPVDVSLAANANIELQAGAEESTVKVTSSAAKVIVKNNTTKKISVTRANNTISEVAAKGSLTVEAAAGTTTTNPSGSSSWGWGGGSSVGGSSGSGTTTPAKKSCEVKTQAELNAALASSVDEIVIVNGADQELTIGAEGQDRSYSKDLIVNAPQTTIRNYANFKSVTINEIASETWYEYATKNFLKVLAPKPHVVLAGKGKLQGISFGGKVENAVLDVEGELAGDVLCAGDTSSTLTVNVKSDATVITGSLKISTAMSVIIGGAAKNVKVEVTAANAFLTAGVPVDVKFHTSNVNVTLTSGAQGSRFEYASNEIRVNILKTEVKVDVSVDGNVTGTINEGQNVVVDSKGEVVEELPEETTSTGSADPETSSTEPAGTETTSTEPTGTETSSTEPTSTETTSTETSSTEPASTEPTSTETTGTETSSTEPTSTEPTSTETSSTEPTSTEPTSTETSSTEPTSTETSSTEPTSTEPTSTEPTSTETSSTEPTSTEATSTETTSTETTSSEAAGGENAGSGATEGEAASQADLRSFSRAAAGKTAVAVQMETASDTSEGPSGAAVIVVRPEEIADAGSDWPVIFCGGASLAADREQSADRQSYRDGAYEFIVTAVRLFRDWICS